MSLFLRLVCFGCNFSTTSIIEFEESFPGRQSEAYSTHPLAK